ncbi:MAG: phage terminase small subunit P27 family [bacterium]
MGSRGRIPSPIHLVNLKKSHHGSEREKKRKSLGEGKRLNPPSWLSEAGRKIWRRLEPEIRKTRLLIRSDKDAFGRLCEVQVLFERAAAECAGLDSLVTENARGGAKPHPVLKNMMDTASLLQRLGSDFGLTPPGRARLHIAPVEPEAKDPLRDYLFGNELGENLANPALKRSRKPVDQTDSIAPSEPALSPDPIG